MWLISEEMHLRYNERRFDQLRSTGCGSGDRQIVDFMRIIDEKWTREDRGLRVSSL